MGLVRAHLAAGEHDVQRAAPADQPREPLGSARAGNEPKLDLGQAEAGARPGHPQGAGQREFEAPAQGESFDRGDAQPARSGQPVEDGAQRAAVGGEIGRARLGHVLDVGAGGEERGQLGNHDDGLYRGRISGLVQSLVEALDEREAEGVGRRAPKGDPEDRLAGPFPGHRGRGSGHHAIVRPPLTDSVWPVM